MINELNKSEFTLVASGVWICFEKQPTFESIKNARELLDQLTDELIKDRLCSPEN